MALTPPENAAPKQPLSSPFPATHRDPKTPLRLHQTTTCNRSQRSSSVLSFDGNHQTHSTPFFPNKNPSPVDLLAPPKTAPKTRQAQVSDDDDEGVHGPDTVEGLVEFFLDTEAQEIESEIARVRPRYVSEMILTIIFLQDVEDILIKLEALQEALQEATEAYDKLQADLVATKKNLTEILTSKDVKATDYVNMLAAKYPF